MKVNPLVLFLHIQSQESSDLLINPAVMALSAYLKKNNIDAEVLVVFENDDMDNLIERISQADPDLIAISIYSISNYVVEKIVKKIRPFVNIPIVVGGYHPTSVPDEVISNKLYDYVVVGEGEEALLRVVNRVVKKRYESSPNRVVFTGHISSLDDLPLWDREIYNTAFMQAYSIQKLGRTIPVYTGKGCPFLCTFCANEILTNIYGKKQYLRKRSVDSVIEEMKILKERYSPDTFLITDEQFVVDRGWLTHFSRRYSREIGLPFLMMTHVNSLDERAVALLREANCFMVVIGVEVEDEEYRHKMLRKHISNDTIIRAFGLLKRENIKSCCTIMTGLPYETAGMVHRTIDLVESLQPDLLLASVYNPLPNTFLRNLCERNNLLTRVNKRWVEERFAGQYINREFQLLRTGEDEYLRVKMTDIKEQEYINLSYRIDSLSRYIEKRYFERYESQTLLNRIARIDISEKTRGILLIVNDNHKYAKEIRGLEGSDLDLFIVNPAGLSNSLFEINKVFELLLSTKYKYLFFLLEDEDIISLFKYLPYLEQYKVILPAVQYSSIVNRVEQGGVAIKRILLFDRLVYKKEIQMALKEIQEENIYSVDIYYSGIAGSYVEILYNIIKRWSKKVDIYCVKGSESLAVLSLHLQSRDRTKDRLFILDKFLMDLKSESLYDSLSDFLYILRQEDGFILTGEYAGRIKRAKGIKYKHYSLLIQDALLNEQ